MIKVLAWWSFWGQVSEWFPCWSLTIVGGRFPGFGLGGFPCSVPGGKRALWNFVAGLRRSGECGFEPFAVFFFRGEGVGKVMYESF